MARVIRSDRADRDLYHILFNIALDYGQRSADRLLAAVERKSGLYARLPLTGILRDDLAPNLRCFLVRPYLIFYRPIHDGIEVARVLHGSRNIRPDMFAP
jgi:toxin ParE1/3/4